MEGVGGWGSAPSRPMGLTGQAALSRGCTLPRALHRLVKNAGFQVPPQTHWHTALEMGPRKLGLLRPQGFEHLTWCPESSEQADPQHDACMGLGLG